MEDSSREFVRFDLENDEMFLSYVGKLKRRSTFISKVDLKTNDRIVSLCTCAHAQNKARYMVVGRLVPLYQPEDSIVSDTMPII